MRIESNKKKKTKKEASELASNADVQQTEIAYTGYESGENANGVYGEQAVIDASATATVDKKSKKSKGKKNKQDGYGSEHELQATQPIALANSTQVGNDEEPQSSFAYDTQGESEVDSESMSKRTKKKVKNLAGRTSRAFSGLLSKKGEHETGESGAETDVVESHAPVRSDGDRGSETASKRTKSKRFKSTEQRRGHVFKDGELVRAAVKMLDDELHEFVVHKKSIGRELFEAVCDYLNLAERDYFGLRYLHETGIYFWLDVEKEIRKQMEGAHLKYPWEYEFCVKFYPPEPSFMQEELTRYLLCLQVRRDLTSAHGELRNCSFITLALLGSYTVQSELGDYEPELEPAVRAMRFSARQDPQSTEYQLYPEENRQLVAELLERIIELYKTHVGVKPNEADYRFLENAKRLEFYGIEFTDAHDASGMPIRVGIYYNGVVVYQGRVRISRFAWPKVLKLSYHGTDFKLRVRPDVDFYRGTNVPVQETVVFRLKDARIAKRLWKVGVEQHTFYRKKGDEMRKKPTATTRIGTLVNTLGSSRFQYSGRTLYQYRTGPARHNAPPPVNRTLQKGQARSFSTLERNRELSVSNGLQRPVAAPSTTVSSRDVRQSSDTHNPTQPELEPATLPRLAKRRAPDPVPAESSVPHSAPSRPPPPNPVTAAPTDDYNVPSPSQTDLELEAIMRGALLSPIHVPSQPESSYYLPPDANTMNGWMELNSNRDSQPPPLPANEPPPVVAVSNEVQYEDNRQQNVRIGTARPRRFSGEPATGIPKMGTSSYGISKPPPAVPPKPLMPANTMR